MSAKQLALPLPEIADFEVPLQPFLKWAGGKSQLLPQLSPFFPRACRRYHEPFLGGAAVYWHLFTLREQGRMSFQGARLADVNPELINCYLQVRDHPDLLVQALMDLQRHHSRERYYHIRQWDTAQLNPVQRAARFIYLNKTCYNGLYRVNRSGQFNVPIGRYQNPQIFVPEVLIKNSAALKDTEIVCAPFQTILDCAEPGDFIYFDPPYAPVSKTANFTSYTAYPFGQEAQEELAAVFRQLHQRGCKLMLSNSWTESVRRLYRDFYCLEVKAARAINSKADRRHRISELLVINYDPSASNR